jgi:hypothetical protein
MKKAKAIRHAHCATIHLVDNEHVGDYQSLEDAYVKRFGPRDRVELDLVVRMAHASHALYRVWNLQNETINLQMDRMAAQLALECTGVGEHSRMAAAFDELAKGPTFPLLLRYEASLNRQYHYALRTLTELRDSVPLVPPGSPVPEPDPEPEPNEANSPVPAENSDLTARPAASLKGEPTNSAPQQSPAHSPVPANPYEASSSGLHGSAVSRLSNTAFPQPDTL